MSSTIDKEAKLEEEKKDDESDLKDDTDQREKILAYINELKTRNEQKSNERRMHQVSSIQYPDETFFARLDSSIKKNTAFVKKLRNMTESQKDVILKDLNSLNLSHYVSELAHAIVEVKIKATEISLATKICSALHLRYRDFAHQLRDSWAKFLPKKPTDAFNASKMRIDLRLFAELLVSGILTFKEALPMFGGLLTLLITGDKEKHNNLSILLNFCKQYGIEFAGLVPRKMRLLAEKFDLAIPQSDFLPVERKKGVFNLLKDYYRSLVEHVQREHDSLARLEKDIHKAMVLRGDIPSSQKESFEARNSDFQKLWTATQQFADVIDEDVPVLSKNFDADDLLADQTEVTFDLTNRFKSGESNAADLVGPDQIWEDEETRTFYVLFPDLKELIPAILYKDSLKEAVDKNINNSEQVDGDNKKNEIDDVDAEQLSLVEAKENGPAEDDKKPTNQAKSSSKTPLDAFLAALPDCVNRDHIDKAALTFATTYNTKNNRKKLVEALLGVYRTRLDLLPFYGRFVAQLYPIMPSVGDDLVNGLKRTFRFNFKSKNQINFESKMKNIRFIGEMVKFGIFQKADALSILNTLLNDFHHHHIDMTCAMFETCGQYLYRTPESHPMTKTLLEKMMRFKMATVLDMRHVNMIENVYFTINPPEVKQFAHIKQKSPLELYIEHVVYEQLSRSTIPKVCNKLRKLNWKDKEISAFAVSTLSSAWSVKYDCIVHLTQVLVTLKSYQYQAVESVVDNILEDIRLGMEINMVEMNQRRLAVVRYLAECYNYRLIDSDLVFRVLYSLLIFGINYEDVRKSPLDQPDNLMRVRLVAIILQTCGRFFSKKKLDYFIYFFQRFYWFKKAYFQSLPEDQKAIMGEASLDMLYKEIITSLMPKFKGAKSYEEALKQLETQFKELANKAKEFLPDATIDFITSNKSSSSTAQSAGAVALEPIKEEGDSPEEDEEADDESLANEEDEDDTDDSDKAGEDSDIFMDEEFDEEEIIQPSNVNDHDHLPSKRIVPPEDDEFQREFDRIVNESLASRASQMVRSNVEIAIPILRETTEKKNASAISLTDNFTGDGKFSLSLESGQPMEEKQNDGTFHFRVMTRNAKSNKPQLKPVAVSADSELVQKFLAQQRAAQEEKKQYKQLILDINQRSEQQQNSPGDKPPSTQSAFRGGHHGYQQQQQQRFGQQSGYNRRQYQ